MSQKSELKKATDNLRRTRKAILGRGGEITATAGLEDLPEAILNIPADTSLTFYEDSSAAYKKTVPKNVGPYAMIKQIGGMTFTGLRSVKTTEFKSEGTNGVIETLVIPEAIQSLEGYGEGLDGTYCNTVDLANKKYLLYLKTKTLDGTGAWKTGSVDGLSTNYFALKIEEANTCVPRMCVSDMYKNILISSITTEIGIDVYDSAAFGGFVVAIRPHNVEKHNPTTLKAMLAENPVILKYARLVPIETDISHLLPSNKFIEVESGGTITAVNEYEYDVPSTIKYLQRVGG